MCWTPELVEFPCEWKDEGQDNFEELGIEPTTHTGKVLLDVKSITRMNDADCADKTTVDINGSLWIITVSIEKMKLIVKKCGVSVKKYEDILSESTTYNPTN